MPTRMTGSAGISDTTKSTMDYVSIVTLKKNIVLKNSYQYFDNSVPIHDEKGIN